MLALAAPGEPNRLYVVDSNGVVSYLTLPAVEGSKPAPFLDLRKKAHGNGETGLVGFAFHPDFAKNHRAFISYRPKGSPLTVRVAEYNTKTKEEKIFFNNETGGADHTGGHLLFGPDGYLYLATGDGNSTDEDKDNDAQNLESLLGKMLRLDVSQSGRYSIPSDNPFKKGGGKKEICAWGLRHPWRYSIDAVTGRIYAGDNGVVRREEINLIECGKNYGWNKKEGTLCMKEKNCADFPAVDPIHEYKREEGYSVIGGYIYRGEEIPSLRGQYVFGDFGTGTIWALRLDSDGKKVLEKKLLLRGTGQITSFGEDTQKELYIMTIGGTLSKLVAAQNPR